LWLVGSIVLTMLLHILILYVRPLSVLFSVSNYLKQRLPLYFLEMTTLYLSCSLRIRLLYNQMSWQVTPLSWADWMAVLYLSLPVCSFVHLSL
jgi:hypothetical protein